jgi:hypothetical protein
MSLTLSSRRLLALTICLLIGAVAIHQYRVTYDVHRTVVPFPEPLSTAYSIRHLGVFGNPFSILNTGPSTHLAPLFPGFLALVFRVFGDGPTAVYVCEWSAAIAAALLIATLPLISQCLGMGFFTGVLASVLWLVAKMKVFPYWEATYTSVLVAVATCMFYRRIHASPQLRRSRGIPLAFMIGVLLLLTPTLALVLAGWLLWLSRKDGLHSFRSFNLPLILIPTVMVLPWMVRNYIVFHRIIPFRGNLGLELSVSNNDCAAYSVRESEAIHCFDKIHPNLSIEEAKKLLSVGEPRYNDLQFRQALSWIANHPRRFLELSRERFVAFWLPNEGGDPIAEVFTRRVEPRIQRLLVYGTTIFSVVGLCLLAARDTQGAMILGLWLGIYPLIYYFVQYEDRYRYPIMWITFLLAAYPVAVFSRRRNTGRKHSHIEEVEYGHTRRF